jgi:uncharacterized protein YlaN (UPF0358 family)
LHTFKEIHDLDSLQSNDTMATNELIRSPLKNFSLRQAQMYGDVFDAIFQKLERQVQK